MVTRSRNDSTGSLRAFYDSGTQETITRFQPLWMDEDFIGAGHSAGIPAAASPVAGYPWVKKIVGAAPPTAALVTNSACGVIANTLTSTSEKQDAALYFNDSLCFDVTKAAIFEARVAYHVVPTGLVEFVFGLQSAWIDGPDNAAFYMQFQSLASGVVNMRTYDGVTATSASSGTTMAVDAYHIFKIDATDVTNVRFFVDGVEANTNRQFAFAATGASAVLQPYISAYKASGTGVGTLYLDMVQVSTNRV
jgi:hypothetical protein